MCVLYTIYSIIWATIVILRLMKIYTRVFAVMALLVNSYPLLDAIIMVCSEWQSNPIHSHFVVRRCDMI